MSKQVKINWDAGKVEVIDNADGTFVVTVDGTPVGRWPTRALADRNADSIRSHQPKKG